MNPFFSKRSVNELVPSIEPIVDALCKRFSEASKTAEPVDLKYCFPALTLDIMNEYCFSTDPHTILKPDFGSKGFDDLDSFLETSLVVRLVALLNKERKMLTRSIIEHPYTMATQIFVPFTSRYTTNQLSVSC